MANRENSHDGVRDPRLDRRAAALRANLQRRKLQQRGRASATGETAAAGQQPVEGKNGDKD
jgi:hypothetical protein